MVHGSTIRCADPSVVLHHNISAHLAAREQLGTSFVKSPLVPTSTSPNPQTIFFR